MELLTKNNCVYIGFFQKTYKYSGTLLLNFDPRWELSVVNVKILITEIDGLPVPWFVCKYGIKETGPGMALVDLEWIDDEKTAKNLCERSVYIEKNAIYLPDVELITSGWINYSLEEERTGYIGKITGENNYAGNLVLTVETLTGIRLIPFHSDLVIKTDHRLKTLTLRLPEGLI